MKIIKNCCYGGYGVNLLTLKRLVLANADCLEKSTKNKWNKDRFDQDLGDGFMVQIYFRLLQRITMFIL